MGSVKNGFRRSDTYILAVDVGSTSIRCCVYDRTTNIRGFSSRPIKMLYPKPGWVEVDPEGMFEQFVAVVKEAVEVAYEADASPRHFNAESNVCYLGQLQEAVAEGNCSFGTIDTWLLYKLTKGAVFATDYSNASTTAMFDPYQLCWSGFLANLLSVPLSILPPVKDTSCKFGYTDRSIFGTPIPIMALAADQQAAMFGECCFEPGDVKLTMGTGTFMSINTGTKPHPSITGLYPLVGWKIGSEVTYIAEGNAADTGKVIQWAQQLGLFSDVTETEKMAQEVQDSDGVFFVPAFSGLQAPLNDPNACASFMGLKPSTTKTHLVRAILESIAFRNKQLYDTMLREIHIPVTHIRANGGICNNQFVMQLTADLLTCDIERPNRVDMSCLGAAFLAGLAIGYWDSREELKKIRSVEKIFKPQAVPHHYKTTLENWQMAVRRSMDWYNKTKQT